MIKRDAEKTLHELAKGYPVLSITGPRQSGKTTLAEMAFPDKTYVSFENPDIREMAKGDPRAFINNYKKGAIFDEVQRVPEILSYLQEIVDHEKRPGHFILTGSQQFNLFSGITQSLAGRSALISLLPFTLHELHITDKSKKSLNLDNVMFTGLYPPVHDRKLDPQIWYANYVNTYIERDVRQLINVRDLSGFQRFVRLCAGRTGQLLNLSDLASDAGITHNTAKSWISILEASYIIFLLQPHHENFNKRLIKTPKLYFHDTGLACWLLNIQNSEQLNSHSMRGMIFETFIMSELFKSRFNKGLPGNYFFWRDRSGNEIDCLIENGDMLQPLEIKSGMTINSDFFTGLKKWLALSGKKGQNPALVYGGNESLEYKDFQVYSWKDKGFL